MYLQTRIYKINGTIRYGWTEAKERLFQCMEAPSRKWVFCWCCIFTFVHYIVYLLDRAWLCDADIRIIYTWWTISFAKSFIQNDRAEAGKDIRTWWNWFNSIFKNRYYEGMYWVIWYWSAFGLWGWRKLMIKINELT